jgi:hypothetical protein
MIVKKDEILAEGKLDAEIILKKPDTLLLMSGDMSIDNLKFRSIPLGNLAIKADNHTGDQITFSSTLSGELNNFTL